MKKLILISMLVLILIMPLITADNFVTKLIEKHQERIFGEQPLPPIFSEDMPNFNHPQKSEYLLSNPRLSLTPEWNSINLKEGWNLISFSTIPTSGQEIDDYFSSIDGSYDVIYTIVNTINGYEIKDYNPNKPDFLNTLTEIDETMGLWVYMNEDNVLSYYGYPVETTNFDLRQGWNLISYPSLDLNNINLAFQNLLDNEHIFVIATYNSETEGWQDFNSEKPDFLNTLTQLNSNHGYWIYIYNNINFYFTNSNYNLDELDNNLELGPQSIINGPNGIVATKTNNQIQYYHKDSFGNVRKITNELGEVIWEQDYSPFGKQIKATGKDNSYKLTNQEYEYDLEVYNLKARQYSPELRRFFNPDPILSERSPFIYANNNPLKYSDPSGLSPQDGDYTERDHYWNWELDAWMGSTINIEGEEYCIVCEDGLSGAEWGEHNFDSYIGPNSNYLSDEYIKEKAARQELILKKLGLWSYPALDYSWVNLVAKEGQGLIDPTISLGRNTLGLSLGLLAITGKSALNGLNLAITGESTLDGINNIIVAENGNIGQSIAVCPGNCGLRLTVYSTHAVGQIYAFNPSEGETWVGKVVFDYSTKQFSADRDYRRGGTLFGIGVTIDDGGIMRISAGQPFTFWVGPIPIPMNIGVVQRIPLSGSGE